MQHVSFSRHNAQRIANTVKTVEHQRHPHSNPRRRSPRHTTNGYWGRITEIGTGAEEGRYAWTAQKPEPDGTLVDDTDWQEGTLTDNYAVEAGGKTDVTVDSIVFLRPAMNEDYYLFLWQPELNKVEMIDDLSQGDESPAQAWLLEWDDVGSDWVRTTLQIDVYGDEGFRGVAFGKTPSVDSGDVADVYFSTTAEKWYAVNGGYYFHGEIVNNDIDEGLEGEVQLLVGAGMDERDITVPCYSPYSNVSIGDTVSVTWNTFSLHWDCLKAGGATGCGLEHVDGEITLKMSDIVGWGLVESGFGDCKIDMEPISISATYGVFIDTNVITSDGRPFTNAFEFKFANADVAGCGLQTATSPTEVALAVNRDDLMGSGLIADDTPSSCGMKLDLSCGLQFNGNQVEVNNLDLVGEGLIQGTGCELNIDPGCGLELSGGLLTLKMSDIVGDGMENLVGCELSVKAGCGLLNAVSGELEFDFANVVGDGLKHVTDPTCDFLAVDETWLCSFVETNCTVTPGAHTHVSAEITDLEAFIDSVIDDSEHTHVEADITDLQDYALVGHTHVEADITDLQAYLLNISGEALNDLGDVTAPTPVMNELLSWSGSAWINQNLSALGISEDGHVHDGADITTGVIADAQIAESSVTQHEAALSIIAAQVVTGEFADGRISESNVTQHQTALTITESQISDLDHSPTIGDTITGGTSNRILFEDGSNQLAESLNLTFDGTKLGINTGSPHARLHLEAGVGTEAFDIGMVIRTGDASYTTGHGPMIQFENEDVVMAGVRGIREGGWSGGLQFFTHNSSSGNTYGTTFLERMRIDANGRLGLGTTPSDKFHVTVSDADAVECLKLEQLDLSEGFCNFVSTSAANTTNPITTYTSGNSVQGFVRIEINGVDRWMPFYDAPTS